MQSPSDQSKAEMDDSVVALSQLFSTDVEAETDSLTTRTRASSSQLTSLRAVRSDRALISRLPYETMVAIFRAIDDPPRIIRDESSSVGRVWLGWIYVSHVCRTWRDIAIRDSSLWSNICFVLGPQWTETVLGRSNNYPINIDYEIKSHHSILLDKATLHTHIHHVRQLSLSIPLRRDGASYARDLLPMVSSAAHCLDTLSLKASPAGISPADLSAPRALPRAWSAECFPRLRHLDLQNFLIKWRSTSVFPFGSLLTLKLGVTRRGTQLKPKYLPSLSNLLIILDQMPELRLLDLNGILPTVPPQHNFSSPPPRTVSLPNLTELRLSGKARECANVLSTTQLNTRGRA